jgi:Mannosylglycerate hydrolase MGH1-like glycoside hydrolase domain
VRHGETEVGAPTWPTATEIRDASRRVLEGTWVPSVGFSMPNARQYPWQWLWDSCFHSIAWSGLGDSRCVTELESILALQLPNGFVPHMGYQTNPRASLRQWHVPGRSDITQPPMYGHALRVLDDRGFAVDHLYAAATHGLNYLFDHRRDPASGLIRVVHPWETGCDDSNRWDGCVPGPFTVWKWKQKKKELERSIELVDEVAAGNPGFDVGSVGFSALVAFNTSEVAALTGDRGLVAKANRLADDIDARWVASKKTWADVCLAGPQRSTDVRTLDALLPVLVSGNQRYVDAVFVELFDPKAFWRPYAPAGTAADEPSYDPDKYWRGSSWPQLTDLLMVAAHRRGHADAPRLAEALVRGCVTSGYAEHWNPESGAGLGAIPQGWGALANEGVLALNLRQNPAQGTPDETTIS